MPRVAEIGVESSALFPVRLIADMPSNPPVIPTAINYSSLPGFSNLFLDYCQRNPGILSFFGSDFDLPGSFPKLSQTLSHRSYHREGLVEMLLSQNERWGIDTATRENIEALRNPASAVVITGQQVGLFLGPLYTIYKIITTIRLAKSLERETGARVVPVFWMAGEDHDFKEIASVTTLSRSGVQSWTYQPEFAGPNTNRGPVGRLTLTERITPLINELIASFQPGGFEEELKPLLHKCYAPGKSLTDAFAALLKALLPGLGLVLVSSDDVLFKKLCVPFFEKEIADPEASTRVLEKSSQILEESSYHAQVKTRPTNLFMIHREGRLPLDYGDDAFHLRGTTTRFQHNELRSLLAEQPEIFSPNVVLRPVLQDYLFPNLAYVAGPGETSYFAQYKEVYSHFGVPMPIIFPRASLTLLDAKTSRLMDHYPLSFETYSQSVEKILRLLVDTPTQHPMHDAFGEARAEVKAIMQRLSSFADQRNSSLNRSAKSTEVRLIQNLETFQNRLIRAEKKKMHIDRNRIDIIQNHIFPQGGLQERKLSSLHFLQRYGLDFFNHLFDSIPLNTEKHHLISI